MRRSAKVLIVTVVTLGLAAFAAPGRLETVLRAVRAQAWHLDIDKAMDAIGVASAMIVGEAGAGDGYFTLPMARRVGASGQVYANDISSRALNSLAARARRESLSNVHIVEGNVDDPLFPRRDLELVVIVHAFHDFDRPVEWLVNLRKYLKPGAVVAIIDLDPAQGSESHFWPLERIQGYASKAGYETTRVVDNISKHLIVLLKPGPMPATSVGVERPSS